MFSHAWQVLSPSGTLLTPDEIRSKFENAGKSLLCKSIKSLSERDSRLMNMFCVFVYKGVPTEGPIVASCGTGVTACILALVNTLLI